MRELSYLNPYLIAEIGVNHDADINQAMRLIDSAALAGCDAVKFQLYKAETLASKNYSNAYWDMTEEPTESQYELFKKYDKFSREDYVSLSYYAHNQHGIDFIATPFDMEMVEIASETADIIKIASADITNAPLVRACARTNKPIILSTGASTIEEIQHAIDIVGEAKGYLFALLHCVLNYPLNIENVQMKFIDALLELHGEKAYIGYSDHTKPRPDGGLEALLFAAVKGALVLEKHFTLDPTAKGNDHYHSMTGDMASQFLKKLHQYRMMYGMRDLTIESHAHENARRRIFLRRKVTTNEILCEDDLIPLRANVGLEVDYWDKVIGLRTNTDLEPGDYLTLDKIERM